MQEIIKNLIKHLNDEGMDRTSIAIYLQGTFDGINSFSEHLKLSKMEIKADESDPLFIHTWNYVINSLTEKMEGMVKQALKGVPEGLGVIDVNKSSGSNTVNQLDQTVPRKSSPQK